MRDNKPVTRRLSFGGRVVLVVTTLGVVGVVAHSQDGGPRPIEFNAGDRILADEVNSNFALLHNRVHGLDVRLQQIEEGRCPRGYTVEIDPAETNNDDWIVCKKHRVYPIIDDGDDDDTNNDDPIEATDWIVKVGDFWIDRYELSGCAYRSGDSNGNDTDGIGCSRRNVVPVASRSWFQVAQFCANAGKRLCTNLEWQTAASGTPDFGESDGAGGRCLTQADGPRLTGRARDGVQTDDCVSRFGAEDMVGNLSEWVADWQQAGTPWIIRDEDRGARVRNWPNGYGDDATINVDGITMSPGAITRQGVPAAPTRGGSYEAGTAAGVFFFALYDSPNSAGPGIGARCCIGHP